MRLARHPSLTIASICLASVQVTAQHSHPAPEQLGSVQFTISCDTAVQSQFRRAVALLHSFAYSEAEKQFRQVLVVDPACAIAHWGIAMSYYHQLWEPPLSSADYDKGKLEIREATTIGTQSEREEAFISALASLYSNAEQRSLHDRMVSYQSQMSDVARRNPQDTESQVFYALAVLSTAAPTDATHTNQKKAAALLEPLYAANPQHPGIAHYLIHAYDNAEMASQGINVARAYSKIAPSAPHALHMPSHIFTRLGMWNESVESNLAAREAAHEQGDVGEELHAMDYLTYAYLQLGQEEEAAAIIADLNRIKELPAKDFKVGYAATAMPVRFAIERQQWREASAITAAENVPPEVSSVAVWANAVGLARSGHPEEADRKIEKLEYLRRRLSATKKTYWAVQVEIQIAEAKAWTKLAKGDESSAKQSLVNAADLEDSIEKLPLTPGPMIPAREQLGNLLLELKETPEALKAFEASLLQSPGRRNALLGALKAAQQSNNQQKAKFYKAAVLELSNR